MPTKAMTLEATRRQLNSLLLERVTDPDESTRMPPEGKPLTAEQLARIKTWIDALRMVSPS